ncbi:MAG: CZB domain-containing protein [Chloroherpetonaceae bacterium]|nr:CZB domain-containing protein [Chloroherpetonaceae bacterium]MDW8436598.1 CZB domain-containing protein [Chloroherpetonaceae bacterium]
MAISFRQWLSKLTQNQNANETAQLETIPEPEVVDPVEAEAAGLNFHTAIVSHQNWKARFKAMIESGVAEALNPDVIARDDQCAVGKWIHGVAKERFGNHPLWEKLRGDHAFFHTCASRVLVMIIRGEKQKALQEIQQGAYARASNDVIMDLAMFYKVIKAD